MAFAAQLVVLLHFLFVAFVVLGGLLVWWKPRLAWLHIPAVLWATLVMTQGWICPLTPLENWLLRQAGEQGYDGGFIERYLLAVLYPEGLTRSTQTLLGVAAATFNLALYGLLCYRRRR